MVDRLDCLGFSEVVWHAVREFCYAAILWVIVSCGLCGTKLCDVSGIEKADRVFLLWILRLLAAMQACLVGCQV